MGAFFHIVQREYLSRVRNKSFFLMALLVPILILIIVLIPIYLSTRPVNKDRVFKIGLIDDTHIFQEILLDSTLILEHLSSDSIKELGDVIVTNQLDGILYINMIDSEGVLLKYYSDSPLDRDIANRIEWNVYNYLLERKLSIYDADIKVITDTIHDSVLIEHSNIDIGYNGRHAIAIRQSLAILLSISIYLFIIFCSTQVMRAVLEEKTNRIIELIITSVSPIKFLAGKIIGIALFGLTQIICWLLLMYGLVFILSQIVDISLIGHAGTISNHGINPYDIANILNNLSQINFEAIILAFLGFFIGGYLLYSAVFAGVSALANSNDDLRQVSLLVTSPLLLSIIVLANTISNPNGFLSTHLSYIPFTSPIVMMGRVVNGVSTSELITSLLILFVVTAIFVWFAAKIYKNNILFRGANISFRSAIKWLKNK